MSAVESDVSTTNQGIQVIARAAAILRALKDNSKGMSLGQIAGAVGLPRSTVQRIISSLLNERLVMSASPEGGYCLGPEIQSLAAAGRVPVADMVRPYIAALSQETGETVDLAELRHDHMVFVDQIIGTHRLRTVARVGEEFPLISTANGKASLALLDDDTVMRLAKQEMQLRHAGHARDKKSEQTELSSFMKEVEQIRQQGLAYDLGEHTDGISAVGAAFIDSNEQIYSVSIPVPTHRFVKNRQVLTENLLYALTRIKTLLNR